MNKMRRKKIYTIINRLNSLIASIKDEIEIDFISILSDIIEDVEFIFFEEEEYKDNIPENLQGGYRYEMAEEACDNLEEVKDLLEYIEESDDITDVINSIKKAIDYLNDASC